MCESLSKVCEAFRFQFFKPTNASYNVSFTLYTIKFLI